MGSGDDLVLIEAVDAAMDEAARRAGGHLVCRPGCTECCIGPFLITALDARRLRRGVEQIEQSDAARAARVLERAAAAADEMRPHFDPAREEEFATRFDAVPCPALDPQTGQCDLYRWRPVTCRTFGPPVRFAGGDTPSPCRLCFTSATPEEIEESRVDIDPDGVEEQLLEELAEPDTIVAFALAEKG